MTEYGIMHSCFFETELLYLIIKGLQHANSLFSVIKYLW